MMAKTNLAQMKRRQKDQQNGERAAMPLIRRIWQLHRELGIRIEMVSKPKHQRSSSRMSMLKRIWQLQIELAPRLKRIRHLRSKDEGVIEKVRDILEYEDILNGNLETMDAIICQKSISCQDQRTKQRSHHIQFYHHTQVCGDGMTLDHTKGTIDASKEDVNITSPTASTISSVGSNSPEAWGGDYNDEAQNHSQDEAPSHYIVDLDLKLC
jgi:hypothetical protein